MTTTATAAKKSRKTTQRKGRTVEQKRAEMEALHAQLTEGVERLTHSEEWRQYLDFMRSFHAYSFNNLMLILMQRPDAAAVAGFRAWQEKGRQVRKGEHGIRILCPGTVRVRRDAAADAGQAGTDDDEDAKRLIFFPVSVFDISQTDPIEGAPDHSTIAHQLTGEDPAEIFGRVVAYLTAQGITVDREPMTRRNGYTTPTEEGKPPRVAIAEGLTPAQAAKTALHEAAHVLLGHMAQIEEYAQHRGRMEVEAESVAYVVAGVLGLDTSSYSTGYVAGWAGGDVEKIRETAARVLATAHQMIEALEPSETAAASAQAA